LHLRSGWRPEDNQKWTEQPRTPGYRRPIIPESWDTPSRELRENRVARPLNNSIDEDSYPASIAPSATSTIRTSSSPATIGPCLLDGRHGAPGHLQRVPTISPRDFGQGRAELQFVVAGSYSGLHRLSGKFTGADGIPFIGV